MDQSNAQQEIIERILAIYSLRKHSYAGCIQTSIFRKTPDGLRNLLTKFECLWRGSPPVQEFNYDYKEVGIVRRFIGLSAVGDCFKRIATDHALESGRGVDVDIDANFSLYGKTRYSHSEWADWPGDSFTLEPQASGPWSPSTSLTSVRSPYFTSLTQVLKTFFQNSASSWGGNEFRGQVIAILPDFRARIDSLLLAPRSYKAEIQIGASAIDELLVKTCIERRSGEVVHETFSASELIERDLADGTVAFAMALIHEGTQEALHEKIYREGLPSRDPGVLVDTGLDEIEQALLSGECETIELKQGFAHTTAEKLAKTAVAFANTRGGKIIFGISDDHRVTGCDVTGAVDRVTSILRDHCDPVPDFKIRLVQHSESALAVVDVHQSSSAVHVVKDHGPLVRANASNRRPTSHELTRLYQDRIGRQVL